MKTLLLSLSMLSTLIWTNNVLAATDDATESREHDEAVRPKANGTTHRRKTPTVHWSADEHHRSKRHHDRDWHHSRSNYYGDKHYYSGSHRHYRDHRHYGDHGYYREHRYYLGDRRYSTSYGYPGYDDYRSDADYLVPLLIGAAIILPLIEHHHYDRHHGRHSGHHGGRHGHHY